jgi:hypothetical protein
MIVGSVGTSPLLLRISLHGSVAVNASLILHLESQSLTIHHIHEQLIERSVTAQRHTEHNLGGS